MQALTEKTDVQMEEFKELMQTLAELPPENRKDAAIFTTAIIATFNTMNEIKKKAG